MSFNINNRRYTGSKFKLKNWIRDLIAQNCEDADSFCDLFAGTGIVTDAMIDDFNSFYINDLLFSNEVIYKAFFQNKNFSDQKIINFAKKYRNLDSEKIEDNFFSKHFGDKYFSNEDAKKIGFIRDDIQANKGKLNEREFSILLASLIFSLDRCANTVGHYEAFFRNGQRKSKFTFELIDPVIKGSSDNRKVNIYRKDANLLVDNISPDIFYIDPPYSSRQYSRFYHVLETIAKWDNPELFGEAKKPKPENMSEYCRAKAVDVFKELILSLKTKYIVVSYNNTYSSKSKSSENKMSLEQIEDILKLRGETKVFSTAHKAFNSGKTNFSDHKEYLFITKVGE